MALCEVPGSVTFAGELRQILPPGLPHRDSCIEGAARHLDLIVEANQHFNLTRIVSPREAAIKHVADSVIPWRLFGAASHVVDAGSGAGFPGIPLALVFPETRFTLLESTQKKARFLASAVQELGLSNVEVRAERAEDWLKSHWLQSQWLKTHRAAVVTARAVAPLNRAVNLFAAAQRGGAKILLYKGPDAESEIAEAAAEAAKRRVSLRVVERYELPDALGTRTIVEISA